MQSRKLCGEHSAPYTSWVLHIATRAAARWACNTAANMSRAVFPKGLEMLREALAKEAVVITEHAGNEALLASMGYGFERVV